MYSNRKVGSVSVLSVVLLNDYVRGNQFRKVVHSKSGKDFLEDVFRLFCVEMEQANGILQLPERGFNAPTHGIKVL